MQRLILICTFLLLIPLSLPAQDMPRLEVFGGYSFLKANPGTSVQGANSSGWNASANYSLGHRLGLKADLDGHYCCSGDKEHNFLFGPQLSFRSDRHVFFFHAMAGASHGSSTCFCFSETAAAWAVGGGLDIHLFSSKRIALRVAQVDYLGTHYAESYQHNFRYSGGVVFRFGTKE